MSETPMVPGLVAGRPAVETARPANDPADLRRAAEQFESLFLQTLLERMREAQLEGGFFGSTAGSDIYEGMFTRYLADHLADRSPLGIADLLVEQWSGLDNGAQAARGAVGRLEAIRARHAYEDAMATPGLGRRPQAVEESEVFGDSGAPRSGGIPQVPLAGTDGKD